MYWVMAVPQPINFFTPKTTSYFLYLPTYVLVNAHAKFFSQPPFLPSVYLPVWPDWAIFCSLGNFLKPLAPINLLKSPTFLGNYCKGVKIYHFSCELIFGQLVIEFWQFFTGHTDLPSTKRLFKLLYFISCIVYCDWSNFWHYSDIIT